MNPEAKIADPGMKMEAYYDEKLKRWIFPGDDPAEVAKPLAPPPTMPVKKNPEDTPAGTQTPAKNDPLAALMAPAARTPIRSVGQGGDPLGDLMAPPRVPRSHLSEPRVKAGASRAANMNLPASAKKVVVDNASKPPAPHFVIFKPAPTPANDEQKTD